MKYKKPIINYDDMSIQYIDCESELMSIAYRLDLHNFLTKWLSNASSENEREIVLYLLKELRSSRDEKEVKIENYLNEMLNNKLKKYNI